MADGRGDAPPADLAAAGVDDPCNTVLCDDGLVCAGGGDMRFCRPPCAFDAGICPDGEACGRLVVGGTIDPTVPMACFSSVQAGEYESCLFTGCEPGMRCVNSLVGKFCYISCVDDNGCASDQTCFKATLAPVMECHNLCTSDGECPPAPFHCAGFGPYPDSHCVPGAILAPFAACTGEAACPPGHRCTGLTGETIYCYPICPAPVTCPADQICVTVGVGEFCFKTCSPVAPSACSATEVCVPNVELLEAYCLPATGGTTSCGATPCVLGKICVNSLCRQACDDQHPCTTGTCTVLTADGKPLPWKACL